MRIDYRIPPEVSTFPSQLSEIRMAGLENGPSELTRDCGEVWPSYRSRERYGEVAGSYFLGQIPRPRDREECYYRYLLSAWFGARVD